uniref:hAT-like transposase RNase-H fold domain-containing protein n=1 Tax=Fagus sylvatica TaxID=28930 RepID=A0A2N9F218_FAGSY
MVISEQWMSYREDDVGKAQTVRDYILNDVWWDNVDYIVRFTEPIYEMIRVADTDSPILHRVYEMWDSMIEKVKKEIYRFEGLEEDQSCTFFDVVYNILIDRWTKNCTALHCLAHSLNPKRDEYNKGKTQKWDIGGDSWDEPFGGGGPGLLEIANLSLDEPEMELRLVEIDGEDNGEEDDVM